MKEHQWRLAIDGEAREESGICTECGKYASEASQPCDWRPAAGIPRRICVDKMTEAELAIRAAIAAVERAGADVRLTAAVVLLGKAQDRVADFVDGVNADCEACLRGEPVRVASSEPMAGTFTISVLRCGHTKMERAR